MKHQVFVIFNVALCHVRQTKFDLFSKQKKKKLLQHEFLMRHSSTANKRSTITFQFSAATEYFQAD